MRILLKKQCNPFLSEKVTAQTNMSLVEKDKLLSNKTKIAEIFSNCFKNIVKQLRIITDEAKFDGKPILFENPVDVAIEKFKKHHSVKLFRGNIIVSDMLKFESNSLDDMLSEVANLNSAKNSIFKNIPIRGLKEV